MVPQGVPGGAGDVDAAAGEDRVVGVGEFEGGPARGVDRVVDVHLVTAELPRRLGDVFAGNPRGDGAVQAWTTSNSSARSAATISAGSRSVPTTRIRRPSGWKSSKNTPAHVSAPGGLWAPSMIVNGWTPNTSNRPGT